MTIYSKGRLECRRILSNKTKIEIHIQQTIPDLLKNMAIFFIFGHIPKLFFRDADDFDNKTLSSNVEGVKKLVNVALWGSLDLDSQNDSIGIKSRPLIWSLGAFLFP